MRRALVGMLLFLCGSVSAVTLELNPDKLDVVIVTEPNGGAPYAIELKYEGDLIYKYNHANFSTINAYKHVALTKAERAAQSKGWIVLNTHLYPNSSDWMLITNQVNTDEILSRLKDLEQRVERVERK